MVKSILPLFKLEPSRRCYIYNLHKWKLVSSAQKLILDKIGNKIWKEVSAFLISLLLAMTVFFIKCWLDFLYHIARKCVISTFRNIVHLTWWYDPTMYFSFKLSFNIYQIDMVLVMFIEKAWNISLSYCFLVNPFEYASL